MSIKIVSGCAPGASFRENILRNRGLKNDDVFVDQASEPETMKDAEKAATRINEAIERGEKIALYSDYDCDGWGCCVVFDGFMKLLKYGNYVLKSNLRSEGYGMNIAGVDSLLAAHPDIKLVVTADNGILGFAAADHLHEKGIDLVVTDHHLPDKSGKLPTAVAVVDPHRLDDTSYKELCGTGVIYKTLLCLLKMRGIEPTEADCLLDIVGTATVADVVPLVGENRYYVRQALDMMTNESRPEWRMFKAHSNPKKPIIEFLSYNLGFFVGPCINAVSRTTGDIQPAVQIFTGDKKSELASVSSLVAINDQRKLVQREKTAEAVERLGSNPPDRCICIQSASCGDGIVGLVAGDINNRYYRPTIVFALNKKLQWKGSCRSIPGVHMKELLDYINDKDPSVILQYGGHAQAAGLTIGFTKFNRFAELANEYCASIDSSVFDREMTYDWDVSKSTSLYALWEERKKLEPFGCEFPEPVLRIAGRVNKAFVPKSGAHLFLTIGNISVSCFNINDMMAGRNASDISHFSALCTMGDENTLIAINETVEINFNEKEYSNGY